MKKLLVLFFLIFLAKGYLFAQCNVTSGVTGKGLTYFFHAKENLYVNSDLHHGLQVAYAQLFVIQHPEDKDLLQFGIYIEIGKKGNKLMVVPRKIKLTFFDNSYFELSAETLDDARIEAGVFLQQATFRLETFHYTTFQTKSISEFQILDPRTGNKLIFVPYKDILKEQANCIVIQCCLD